MSGMPSGRAAAIVLGAAVLTGATAGVSAAIANVEVPGLLAAGRSTTPPPPKASPTRTTTPAATRTRTPAPPAVPASVAATPSAAPPASTLQPEPEPTGEQETPEPKPVAPTEYIEVDFSIPEPRDGGGGSTNRVEVPKGWSVDARGIQWRDFRDPTDNLNLRVRDDGLADSDEDAAGKARAERERSKGYTELSWKHFTYELQGTAGDGIEYRFAWTGSKGTRYGVERYLLDGNAMVGGYGWEGQLELVEPAVDHALETFVYGSD
jgi:hypothetical protein